MPDLVPDATKQTLDESFLRRTSSAFSGGGPIARITPSSAFVGWFGPGTPVAPSAPPEDVKGRRFDYGPGVNTYQQPKVDEGVRFAQLKMFGRFDLVRMAIQTRKAQFARLAGSVLPRLKPGQIVRGKTDDRSLEIERFFHRPDGCVAWQTWAQQILEQHYVLDAVAIYLHPSRGGGVAACEIIDAATVKRLLDKRGRTPAAPNPAYQQVLHGIVAADYTTDELVYRVANAQPDKVYGYSVVEQILTTVNIAIGRQTSQLNYYLEGNVPEALISVPPNWSVTQIKEFQTYWDSIIEGNLRQRRHAKFVPGGTTYQPTRSESGLMDQFDEWLARLICYAFGLPPLPFVRQINRAVADTDEKRAKDEGLGPLMIWFKNLMDDLIAACFGFRDLEWVWDETPDLDPQVKASLDISDIRTGIKSIDEVRASRGADPIGVPNIVFGLGPMGFVFVRDLVTLYNSGQSSLAASGMGAIPPGLGAPALPPPGEPGGGLGEPPDSPQLSPSGQDILSGVDPAILRAVGLPSAGGAVEPPMAALARNTGLIVPGAPVPRNAREFLRAMENMPIVRRPNAGVAQRIRAQAARAPVPPVVARTLEDAQASLIGPEL